jgi:hypothetical protein
MSMTLDHIFDCSRPLYLESEIAEIDYGQIGSCFLIRSAIRLFVVTAGHCLWQHRQPTQELIRAVAQTLWIPQRMNDSSPVSFGFTAASAALSTTHASACDFAVIEISHDPLPETTDFYDLGAASLSIPSSGDKLIIVGYPKIINEIEYPNEQQNGKLKPRRLVASGRFVGEGTAPMLDAMQLDEPEKLLSYNGMSGSPIFLLKRQGLGTKVELVGVAVRESKSAATIDFIPTRLMLTALGG